MKFKKNTMIVNYKQHPVKNHSLIRDYHDSFHKAESCKSLKLVRSDENQIRFEQM